MRRQHLKEKWIHNSCICAFTWSFTFAFVVVVILLIYFSLRIERIQAHSAFDSQCLPVRFILAASLHSLSHVCLFNVSVRVARESIRHPKTTDVYRLPPHRTTSPILFFSFGYHSFSSSVQFFCSSTSFGTICLYGTIVEFEILKCAVCPFTWLMMITYKPVFWASPSQHHDCRMLWSVRTIRYVRVSVCSEQLWLVLVCIFTYAVKFIAFCLFIFMVFHFGSFVQFAKNVISNTHRHTHKISPYRHPYQFLPYATYRFHTVPFLISSFKSASPSPHVSLYSTDNDGQKKHEKKRMNKKTNPN